MIKENLTSLNELNHFCEQYDFFLELEKPFEEMDGMILKVVNKEDEVVGKATINDILKIDKDAAKMLNELAKVY